MLLKFSLQRSSLPDHLTKCILLRRGQFRDQESPIRIDCVMACKTKMYIPPLHQLLRCTLGLTATLLETYITKGPCPTVHHQLLHILRSSNVHKHILPDRSMLRPRRCLPVRLKDLKLNRLEQFYLDSLSLQHSVYLILDRLPLTCRHRQNLSRPTQP